MSLSLLLLLAAVHEKRVYKARQLAISIIICSFTTVSYSILLGIDFSTFETLITSQASSCDMVPILMCVTLPFASPIRAMRANRRRG